LTTHLESTRKRQRIHFSHGYWWLLDPDQDRNIRLDPKISQCGWNVGRLCQSLGFGKRTFSRMVKEGLGITGKRWLREIRIVTACHLLRQGDKIEAVAQTLGFRHVSDFTREFKKLMGVPPSRYMKAEHSRSIGFRHLC
jgi:AraC-like DNA-binding protein